MWELKRGCCLVSGCSFGDDDLKIRNRVLQSRRFRLGDLVVGLISELRSGVEFRPPPCYVYHLVDQETRSFLFSVEFTSVCVPLHLARVPSTF